MAEPKMCLLCGLPHDRPKYCSMRCQQRAAMNAAQLRHRRIQEAKIADDRALNDEAERLMRITAARRVLNAIGVSA